METGELEKENGGRKLREKKLEEIRNEIEQVTDTTGRGIDQGIKETVVAFNVNEISTSQSCEGHTEVEGGHRPLPWVEVAASDEPDERFVGEAEAFVKTANENSVSLEELKKGHPEEVYWKLRQEVCQNPLTPEYQAWEKKNIALHGKVTKLLDEFYKDRNTEAGIRLQVDEINGDSFEISSEPEALNKFLNNELTDEEKNSLLNKLPKRQEEMKTFTEFLKKRFLENEGKHQESEGSMIELVESSSLETIKKFDLMQLLLDRKQAAQFGNYDVIESDEHRAQLEKEMEGEYKIISELLTKLGLFFHGKPPTEDNGIYGFSILATKTSENLVKVMEADTAKNDKEFGVLMGYPKTAVDAYQTGEAFDLKTEFPKEELEKLEQEEVLAFLEFMPSKGHWQEELDSVRETQRLIKEKSPRLYYEIIEWRKKEAQE